MVPRIPRFSLLAVLALVAFSQPSLAQDAEGALAGLNALYAGHVRFSFSGPDRLQVEFRDAKGLSRVDLMALDDLDPERIAYSLEEDAVVLACREPGGRCIESECFTQNTVRLTARTTLPRALDDNGAAQAMDALRLIIGAGLEHLAETRSTFGRKN